MRLLWRALPSSTRGGAPQPLGVRLAEPVSVAVTATRDPLSGYLVTIRDADRVPIAATRIEPCWRTQSPTVPPGDYVLEVHGSDDRPVKREPLEARGPPLREEVP